MSTKPGIPALSGSKRSLLLCWRWVVASGVAWAVGWAVTSGIGVALASGWPVYGISGALASQVITGVVLWKVLSRGEAGAFAAA